MNLILSQPELDEDKPLAAGPIFAVLGIMARWIVRNEYLARVALREGCVDAIAPKCGGRGLVTSTFNFGTTVQRIGRCPMGNPSLGGVGGKTLQKVRAKKRRPLGTKAMIYLKKLNKKENRCPKV